MKNKDGREVPIQQFLQDSFLGSWDVLVNTVGNLEAVIGFEVALYFTLTHPVLNNLVDDERAS